MIVCNVFASGAFQYMRFKPEVLLKFFSFDGEALSQIRLDALFWDTAFHQTI